MNDRFWGCVCVCVSSLLPVVCYIHLTFEISRWMMHHDIQARQVSKNENNELLMRLKFALLEADWVI